jgi:hypothetical protein
MTTDTGKVVTGKGNPAEHHFYLVRFGLDGQYKSKTKLPDGGTYLKVAPLAGDQFLALSYDRVNRTPVLRVLNSDGTQLAPIPIPNGLAKYPEVAQGESGDSMSAGKAETSVSSWQLIPARGEVLLYRPDAIAPILEIGPGGAMREVGVAAPPGYELDGFIPSTKQWYARFRRSAVGDSSGVSRKDYLLAQLNPNDGSVVRIFQTAPEEIFDIACEAEGEFVSYFFDKDKFLLGSTDVPR